MCPNLCTYDITPGSRRPLFQSRAGIWYCLLNFLFYLLYMTKDFRMRNKSKWGGVGMNLINPVTMDFLSSTLQGPALRQLRVSLARLHLTWLPAGLLGHEHSPCCGSDVRETTRTLSWVFFPFK